MKNIYIITVICFWGLVMIRFHRHVVMIWDECNFKILSLSLSLSLSLKYVIMSYTPDRQCIMLVDYLFHEL